MVAIHLSRVIEVPFHVVAERLVSAREDVEQFAGGQGSNTLIAPNKLNTWMLTGNDSANRLEGGRGNDVYRLAANYGALQKLGQSHAAGIVVGKFGTAVVHPHELFDQG